ncbi:hypothetical protein [Phytohabitans rumicis]|uniref:Uncharacterized protein n=2 Tax=Phytohabitans rumicis TaxID=1076125 RepID=A0A6V8KXK5_9ACTN|nr:hypothetical protein [Phytohabitans rumicis]GFJ87049.1 hypothetical protein Prum_006910 [Phytohabitans rumicis]
MLAERNTVEKKRLATELIAIVKDESTGTPRVCDYLRGALLHAINKHSVR